YNQKSRRAMLVTSTRLVTSLDERKATMQKSLLQPVSGRDGYEIRIHAKGDRFVVWVGKLTARQFREYERHVGSIVDSFKVGASPEPETIVWFDSVPERIREKFVSWGMLPAVQRRVVKPEQRTVEGWTRLFIDELAALWRTKNNYEQARTWLLKSVDGKRDIASVTQGDLKRWQTSMSKLALTTRNKHVKRVKTMFAGAVEDGILSSSPAAILKEEKSVKRIDRSRQYFVDEATTAKVLRKLPDTNWKLIFCLMRFQGLRRHEVFAIDWKHVDWETNELTVPAETKTGWRTMPIFPETLQYLRDRQEIARDGEKVVAWVGSQESLTQRLRRHVADICGQCWPKVCQQLRSTRRTELDAEFPPHVVNEWLGHDSTTAERHYQQVTPEHLSRAAMMRTVPEDRLCTASCTAEPHRTAEKSGSQTQVATRPKTKKPLRITHWMATDYQGLKVRYPRKGLKNCEKCRELVVSWLTVVTPVVTTCHQGIRTTQKPPHCW
ncbi:MAG: site-specific integrase, partial [bacterium]|nr:site-specific integrase [bacterium]